MINCILTCLHATTERVGTILRIGALTDSRQFIMTVYCSTFAIFFSDYFSTFTEWEMSTPPCIMPNERWSTLMFILTSIYSMQIVSAPWTGLATRDKSHTAQMTWRRGWDRCVCYETLSPFRSLFRSVGHKFMSLHRSWHGVHALLQYTWSYTQTYDYANSMLQ
jgi:hypothetical protein